MPKATPLYDLMLLLSTSTEDERRAKLVADVQTAISAGGGSVERHDPWGRRTMTFRILHQTEAEYHLIQFTGPPSLLESLSHSLRIDDGVLRFRIIKVLPGTPPPPDAPPPSASAPAPAPAPVPVPVPVAAAAAGDDSGDE
jgi:small subunit ribosomal protein S6